MMRRTSTAKPAPVDPMLDFLARAPIGEPRTPEQRAELDHAVAEIDAGRARLVRQEGVPAALEEMWRAEHDE